MDDIVDTIKKEIGHNAPTKPTMEMAVTEIERLRDKVDELQSELNHTQTEQD